MESVSNTSKEEKSKREAYYEAKQKRFSNFEQLSREELIERGLYS